MDIDHVISILDKLGIDEIREYGDDKLLVSCPLAPWLHTGGDDEHPSMIINTGDDESNYYCFACKSKGKLWSLIELYGNLSGRKEFIELGQSLLEDDKPDFDFHLEKTRDSLKDWFSLTEDTLRKVYFDESFLRVFENFDDDFECLQYVTENRGIDFDVAEEFELKYDLKRDTVVFPVRNLESQLVGVQGRYRTVHAFHNYWHFEKSLHLGGIDKAYSNHFPMTILVEGFFDLLNIFPYCKEMEISVICSFGSSLSKSQAELLATLDTGVQVWYDIDEAGCSGAQKAYSQLVGRVFGVKIASWSNETIDPGNMSREIFENIYQKTSQLL